MPVDQVHPTTSGEVQDDFNIATSAIDPLAVEKACQLIDRFVQEQFRPPEPDGPAAELEPSARLGGIRRLMAREQFGG
jgi:hypothetical protein